MSRSSRATGGEGRAGGRCRASRQPTRIRHCEERQRRSNPEAADSAFVASGLLRHTFGVPRNDEWLSRAPNPKVSPRHVLSGTPSPQHASPPGLTHCCPVKRTRLQERYIFHNPKPSWPDLFGPSTSAPGKLLCPLHLLFRLPDGLGKPCFECLVLYLVPVEQIARDHATASPRHRMWSVGHE